MTPHRVRIPHAVVVTVHNIFKNHVKRCASKQESRRLANGLVKLVFRIRLVKGVGPAAIRWRLLAPGEDEHFLESRRAFRLRIDAFRDAEAFLDRMGKASVREYVD